MESMKHFASTKYNVSVITIFFVNKYTVYCMLHWNNIRTATEYITHLHHHNSCAICFGQCITAFNKVYQISAFFRDKENMTHYLGDSHRKKIKSARAISSQTFKVKAL